MELNKEFLDEIKQPIRQAFNDIAPDLDDTSDAEGNLEMVLAYMHTYDAGTYNLIREAMWQHGTPQVFTFILTNIDLSL